MNEVMTNVFRNNRIYVQVEQALYFAHDAIFLLKELVILPRQPRDFILNDESPIKMESK